MGCGGRLGVTARAPPPAACSCSAHRGGPLELGRGLGGGCPRNGGRWRAERAGSHGGSTGELVRAIAAVRRRGGWSGAGTAAAVHRRALGAPARGAGKLVRATARGSPAGRAGSRGLTGASAACAVRARRAALRGARFAGRAGGSGGPRASAGADRAIAGGSLGQAGGFAGWPQRAAVHQRAAARGGRGRAVRRASSFGRRGRFARVLGGESRASDVAVLICRGRLCHVATGRRAGDSGPAATASHLGGRLRTVGRRVVGSHVQARRCRAGFGPDGRRSPESHQRTAWCRGFRLSRRSSTMLGPSLSVARCRPIGSSPAGWRSTVGRDALRALVAPASAPGRPPSEGPTSGGVRVFLGRVDRDTAAPEVSGAAAVLRACGGRGLGARWGRRLRVAPWARGGIFCRRFAGRRRARHRLAALGRRTDRGARRLPPGRRLREVAGSTAGRASSAATGASAPGRARGLVTAGRAGNGGRLSVVDLRATTRCAGASEGPGRSPVAARSAAAGGAGSTSGRASSAATGASARGRLVVSSRLDARATDGVSPSSTCAPPLAALGRRTDRGARRLPPGRRLREVLARRPAGLRRRRRVHRPGAGSWSRHGWTCAPRPAALARRTDRGARRLAPGRRLREVLARRPAGLRRRRRVHRPGAGSWSRHGWTCAPRLAAPGRRTVRGARRLPPGRRLREVLARRPAGLRRRRRVHRPGAGSWSRHGWTCAPRLAAPARRTVRGARRLPFGRRRREVLDRRRPPVDRPGAGSWSRHGWKRGQRKVSRRSSACVPSLAALTRGTARGARRLSPGRRRREVLELRRRPGGAGSWSCHGLTRGQRWGDRWAGRSRSASPRRRPRAPNRLSAACETSAADSIAVPPEEAALGRAAVPQRERLKASRRSSTCARQLAAPGRRTVLGARRLPPGRRLREVPARRPAGLRRRRGAAGSWSRRGWTRGQRWGGRRAGRSRSRAPRRRPRTPNRLSAACARARSSRAGAGAVAHRAARRRSSPWPRPVCAPRRAARSVSSLPSAPAAPVRGRAVGEWSSDAAAVRAARSPARARGGSPQPAPARSTAAPRQVRCPSEASRRTAGPARAAVAERARASTAAQRSAATPRQAAGPGPAERHGSARRPVTATGRPPKVRAHPAAVGAGPSSTRPRRTAPGRAARAALRAGAEGREGAPAG